MINQASKKTDLNSERGITLITLTITIIILVILASITVGVAFGDNGLLNGSKKIEQVKRLEKYRTTIEGVAYEQYADYVMEDKVGSLRDKTKDKIKTLDFVKEVKDGIEDDEINIITTESYLIVIKIDNENTDIIHEGEYDNEPLPKIARSYEENEDGKYIITASATVEKTEKTTSITTLKLIETNNTIENYEEGKEITFEVDKPGKYWIEATTNIGKSVKESIIIEDNDAGKSSFEVMVSDKIYTYNGNYITPEVTVKDGKVILTKDTHYSVDYSDNINAGTGTIKVTGKDKYSGNIITKAFSINKADLTISAENKDMFYDGELPQLSYIGTGYVNGETSEVLKGEIKYEIKNSNGETVELEKKLPVGIYKIIPSGLDTQNYSITYKPGILTVNEKTIDEKGEFTITIEENNCTYDGTEKKPKVTVKDGEIVLKENTDYTLEYSDNINAGTGKAIITGKENYTGKAEKAFIINKANLTITAENKTMTYGGTVPTYTYTGTGYVNSETSSILSGTVSYVVKNSSGTEVTVSKTTSAGTYTITPSGLSSSNYNITYKAGTLTINKAAATMTVSDASKIIQDGSSSTFTYTYDGDGAVTVKSSDTSIATCSVNTSTKTVTVNALKTSTKSATITVSAAAGTNYIATSKTVQIGAIVISGVPSNWTKNNVTVTATTTLTGHTIQTMKDTGNWQTASSQTFTANGTFSARVLNSSSTSVGSKSVTITKIDKTAPTITKIGASVNDYVITASMTATDNSGETPSYWYNIGGETFQTSNIFTVSGAGTYTVGYKAVDKAGNESAIQYKKVTVEQQAITLTFTNGTSISGSFNGNNSDAKTVSKETRVELPAGATVTYKLTSSGNPWGGGSSSITYAGNEYSDQSSKGNQATTGSWTDIVGPKSFTTKTAGTLTLGGGCGGSVYTGSSSTGVGQSGFSAAVTKIEINGVEAIIK